MASSSKTMFIHFCLLATVSSAAYVQKIAECSPTGINYGLNAGDLMMVQSPSYPRSLTSLNSHSDVACSVTVSRMDNQPLGIQYVFINGFTRDFYFSTPSKNVSVGYYDSNIDTSYFSDNTTTQMTLAYGQSSGGFEFSAYQGMAYAPTAADQMTGCWMNGQTFTLTDTTQTIPLFAPHGAAVRNCSWTVNVENGLTLKIKVPQYDQHANMQLRVYKDGASGNGYISYGGGTFDHQDGKTFLFEYVTMGDFERDADSTPVGVLALISGVNRFQGQLQQIDCQFANHSQYEYSFFDNKMGYPNNAECLVPIKYEANRQYLMYLPTTYTEYLADQVAVVDPLHITDGWRYDLYEGYNYLFQSSKDLSVRFASDETVNGAGFTVIQRVLDCTCADQTFMMPCQFGYLRLMKEDGGSFSYCNNVQCQVNVVPNPRCPTSSATLFVQGSLKDTGDDQFLVSKNNQIAMNVTWQVDMNQQLAFNPSSDVLSVTLNSKTQRANVPLATAPRIVIAVQPGTGGSPSAGSSPSGSGASVPTTRMPVHPGASTHAPPPTFPNTGTGPTSPRTPGQPPVSAGQTGANPRTTLMPAHGGTQPVQPGKEGSSTTTSKVSTTTTTSSASTRSLTVSIMFCMILLQLLLVVHMG